MNISHKVDELTDTFSFDHEFCNQLFLSEDGEQAVELLISQLWANNSFLICLKSLVNDEAIMVFDKNSQEKAKIWSLILSESFIRDMGLIVYLSIRGLLIEASVALRRAFETLGVLTHIWKSPEKLQFSDTPNSDGYRDAFRKYTSEDNKVNGAKKRFVAMKLPEIATKFYALTSDFAVHGGTASRLATSTLENTLLACRFYNRSEIGSVTLKNQLEMLSQAHQVLCLEYLTLCLDFGFRSDQLKTVAEFLIPIDSSDGKRSPLMQEQIDSWLQKLRS